MKGKRSFGVLFAPPCVNGRKVFFLRFNHFLLIVVYIVRTTTSRALRHRKSPRFFCFILRRKSVHLCLFHLPFSIFMGMINDNMLMIITFTSLSVGGKFISAPRKPQQVLERKTLTLPFALCFLPLRFPSSLLCVGDGGGRG